MGNHSLGAAAKRLSSMPLPSFGSTTPRSPLDRRPLRRRDGSAPTSPIRTRAYIANIQRNSPSPPVPLGAPHRIRAGATETPLVCPARLLIAVGIIVLLGIAFGRASDAAIVLANFPLGLIGGVAGALLPEGLSVAGFVGFVTLFGIIARNGIMLVSHIRHLEREAPDEPPVTRVLRAAGNSVPSRRSG
ncbi:MAG TPA: efflux RND transporter permease subunit, partial [Kofleriaceae bacterium]